MHGSRASGGAVNYSEATSVSARWISQDLGFGRRANRKTKANQYFIGSQTQFGQLAHADEKPVRHHPGTVGVN
jgi:hypothetical protein